MTSGWFDSLVSRFDSNEVHGPGFDAGHAALGEPFAVCIIGIALNLGQRLVSKIAMSS